MPAEENLAAVRRLVDAWNAHDLERIGSFFHERFENHQLPFPAVRGRDAYLAHCAHWFEAYPDFAIEAVTLFGQDELVCLETRGRGTRRGTFFGSDASGGVEVNHALDILEFEGGVIVSERGYWDFSVCTGDPAPMAGGHRDPGSPFFAGTA